MLVRARGRTRLPPLVAMLALALVLGAVPAAVAVVPSDVPRTTTSFNDIVRVVVANGDTIYVGGAFTAATDASGTVVRNHVAAVDAVTGQLRAWNPNADGAVLALAVSGTDVYLGGAFNSVGAQGRQGLAKVSAATGAVRPGFVHSVQKAVRALLVQGGALYAGGSFGSVDGQSRARLAKFDLSSGALSPAWSPSATGAVRALAADTVGRILVGGSFTELDGRADSGFLGALDAGTGEVAPGFNPSISHRVDSLAVTADSVYAAADGPGGHLRAFGPDGSDRWDLATDGGVQAVDVLGGRVFFGGHFDNVCQSARVGTTGQCRTGLVSRHKLGAVSAPGRLTSWAPQANSPVGVLSVEALPASGAVAVGGAFTRFRTSGLVQPFFAIFG